MSFNSKILLFGEYAVLHGSDALLVPFRKFTGEFCFIASGDEHDFSKLSSNKILKDFYSHFNEKSLGTDFFNLIDWKKFKCDIEAGLYFNSNIPKGYGLGSSGALVAAFYSRYGNEKHFDTLKLKEVFAFFEAYFHGKSSGLDPLVSYLNESIYAHGKELNIQRVDISNFNPFLIDTGIGRSTENFVNIFKEKCKNPSFLSLVTNEFTQATNQSIEYLMIGDKAEFFKTLSTLSSLQLNHFSEMILPNIVEFWMGGLKSNEYYLKLCGAGGGGYVIGFARDKKTIDEIKGIFHENLIEVEQ